MYMVLRTISFSVIVNEHDKINVTMFAINYIYTVDVTAGVFTVRHSMHNKLKLNRRKPVMHVSNVGKSIKLYSKHDQRAIVFTKWPICLHFALQTTTRKELWSHLTAKYTQVIASK